MKSLSLTFDSFLASLRDGFLNCDAADQRSLLAVSGGADSVALLRATAALFPDRGDRIHVAHLDHGLRGADGAADADFVRELAESFGLPVHILSVDVRAIHAESDGASLEATARNVRYAQLSKTAQHHGLDVVVTAHHRDDQAETVLHNVLRGTGLRGLSGMAPSRRLADGCRLIRPMLGLSRAEIQNFLTACGASFRADVTNTDRRFLRNRIRNELLPVLQSEFNAQATVHLASIGSQVRESLQCFDEMAERVLSDCTLERTSDRCRLSLPMMVSWPSFLVRHTLIVLWAKMSWPRQKMSSMHWMAASNAIFTGQSASVSLPGGIQLTVAGSIVRIARSASAADPYGGVQDQGNPVDAELKT